MFGQGSGIWADLPILIKLFCVYFFISGIIVSLLSVYQLFDGDIKISIYGLDSTTPSSIVGTIVLLIYITKFYISIGFYKGLTWIYKIALVDCIFGIAICMFVLLEPIFLEKLIVPNKITFELFFLFPYFGFLLYRLLKRGEVIRPDYL